MQEVLQRDCYLYFLSKTHSKHEHLRINMVLVLVLKVDFFLLVHSNVS